jgi:hypothetical protein
MERQCSKCQLLLDDTRFYVNKLRKDGLQAACKACTRESEKKRPQWVLVKKRRRKRFAQKTKPIDAERQTKPIDAERAREKRRQRDKRRQTTLKGKLYTRIAVPIRKSLKGTKRRRRWETLVGYTVQQLKRHLEQQFVDGMSWEVFLRGEIHIDHIIPIKAFTFSSPEDSQFKACWALKNLRPLWKIDNLKKGTKIMEPFQQFLL